MCIRDRLYAGTYLFVGAPKVGKSFLMAQLAYHVSMGLSPVSYTHLDVYKRQGYSYPLLFAAG